MTIEKAFGILSDGLVNAPSEHEWCEAFKTAIDTMRKYQKIEEIIKLWESDTWTDGLSYDCMVQISGVLEDGNNDQ